MGKGQLTYTEKAQIIEGRDQGLTIQELSTNFGRLLNVVSVAMPVRPPYFIDAYALLLSRNPATKPICKYKSLLVHM